MRVNKQSRVFVCAVVFMLLFAWLVIVLPSPASGIYYYRTFIVCAICLMLSLIMLMSLYINGRLDIFEPITFISFVYLIMYFFAPIRDIVVGKYLWFGYDLFPYGVKATVIAFLGYLAFYFFYTNDFSVHAAKKRSGMPIYQANNYSDKYDQRIVVLVLAMYLFSFAANVFYLQKTGGNSLLYLLTLGLFGASHAVSTLNAPIGFVSNFSYCLPAITLLYFEFGRSKVLKAILFLPMVMLQVARGFRFFVVQIGVSMLAYYYLKRGKRPQLRQTVLVLFGGILFVILMTMFRNSIRAGNGMDLSILNANTVQSALDDAIWFNLRIYRNFYGMVNAIPSRYPYVYGRQMIIGTLIMMIPRLLWPGKLSMYGGVGLTYIIGSALSGTGQAYPNIGEYYYALGALGVVICMSIYGSLAKIVKIRLMDQARNSLDVIEYSILIGCNLQLIIRGYFPSNFWYVVFAILPIWFVRGICRKRGRNG